MPTAAKTMVASATAAGFRVFLMPVDAWKTTKQVAGIRRGEVGYGKETFGGKRVSSPTASFAEELEFQIPVPNQENRTIGKTVMQLNRIQLNRIQVKLKPREPGKPEP